MGIGRHGVERSGEVYRILGSDKVFWASYFMDVYWGTYAPTETEKEREVMDKLLRTELWI